MDTLFGVSYLCWMRNTPRILLHPSPLFYILKICGRTCTYFSIPLRSHCYTWWLIYIFISWNPQKSTYVLITNLLRMHFILEVKKRLKVHLVGWMEIWNDRKLWGDKKWKNEKVIFKLFMTKLLSYRLSIIVFKFTI